MNSIPITFGNTYINFVGSGNLNMGNGQVSVGNTDFDVNVSNNTLTFGGTLVGTGNFALSGNGILSVTGNSAGSTAATNFTGNWFVGNGSTLQVSGNGNNTGSTPNSLGPNPGAFRSAYLNMVDGSTLAVANQNINLGANQSVDVLNNGTVTMNVTGFAGGTTVANLSIASWTGNGTIIKTGNGNLTSTGNTTNTFVGNIVVQQGFLTVGNIGGNTFGTSAANIVLEGGGAGIFFNDNGQTYSTNLIVAPNPNGGSNVSTIITDRGGSNTNLSNVISSTSSAVVLSLKFNGVNGEITPQGNWIGFNGTLAFAETTAGASGIVRISGGSPPTYAGGQTIVSATGLLANGSMPVITAAGFISPTAIYDFGNSSTLPNGGGFTISSRDPNALFTSATLTSGTEDVEYFGDLRGGTSQTIINFSGGNTNSSTMGTVIVGMLNLNSTFNGVLSNENGLLQPLNVTKVGTGIWTWTNSEPYSGQTTIQGGTLQIGNGGVTGSLGNSTVAGLSTVMDNAALAFDIGGDYNVPNQINGTGSLEQKGSGILTLNGSNTFAGATIMTAGTVQTTLIGNAYQPSSIGGGPTLASGLVFNGGTLQYVGNGGSSDRLFTISPNGGFFDASGVSIGSGLGLNGTLILSNPGNVGVSGTGVAENLTLTGNGNADLQSIFVDDSSGLTSLFKTGNGTWTLEGNQLYSGLTTVSNGTFQINGTLSNSNILVTGNGILSNILSNGFINKRVTVANGGIATPGNNAIGTMTVGNFTFGNGGILQVEVDPNTGSNHTFAGTTLNTDILHILNNLDTSSAGGLFNLVSLGTTNPYSTPGTYALFQLDNPSNITGSFSQLNALGAQVGFTSTFAALASNSNIFAVTIAFTPSQGYWTGNTSTTGNWSNNTLWDNGAGVVPNSTGAVAVFPAIQGANGNVTVTVDGSGFTIGNLTFSGSK